MRLSFLLKDIFSISPSAECEIYRLILDSRQIQSSDLFIAIKGTHLDGRQYIADAISRGASAILVEAEEENASISWQHQVPLIPIRQLKNKVGLIAARFYDYPAKALRMIGITGTNGKTSCTHFIAQILQSLKVPCGIIGTLGSGLYGALEDTGLTTPDAITLHKTLRELKTKGAHAVAMEVSSHSIDQGRVNNIEFEMALFTNLTQDHLDYHGDMQTYAAVKRKFLSDLPNKHLVLNADDPYGRQWITELAANKSVFAYSAQKQFHRKNNVETVYADQIECSLQGIKTNIYSPWGEGVLLLPLMGLFNLSNALAVLTALCLADIPFKEVLKQLAQLHSVPGRMQHFTQAGRPVVVVDYSHTPDSLEKALQALRAQTAGQLVCVFGCGGERDHSKRPLMGKIAEQLADQVIVTNDNPRHENPALIAAEIMQGFTYPERVLVELDRSKAIQKGIQWASAKDCVLIAGKGAERYQQIGDDKFPFDDAEKVTSYLGLR